MRRRIGATFSINDTIQPKTLDNPSPVNALRNIDLRPLIVLLATGIAKIDIALSKLMQIIVSHCDAFLYVHSHYARVSTYGARLRDTRALVRQPSRRLQAHVLGLLIRDKAQSAHLAHARVLFTAILEHALGVFLLHGADFDELRLSR